MAADAEISGGNKHGGRDEIYDQCRDHTRRSRECRHVVALSLVALLIEKSRLQLARVVIVVDDKVQGRNYGGTPGCGFWNLKKIFTGGGNKVDGTNASSLRCCSDELLSFKSYDACLEC